LGIFRRRKYPILPKKPVPLAVKITIMLVLVFLATSLSLVVHYNQVIAARDITIVELMVENSKLRDTLRKLNLSLAEVVRVLEQRCCLPEALAHVLIKNEVLAVGKLVVELNTDLNDVYETVESIYTWIINNVKDISDPEIPAPLPDKTRCVRIVEEKYCYYEVTLVQNYIQTPWFTAKHRQGDCEDQAILAYAMIYFYLGYVRGEKVADKLLFAIIDLNSGRKHAAIIMLNKNDVIIVDPGGKYITRSGLSKVFPRGIYEELINYSNYWFEEGGIAYMHLYRVDVENGTYQKVAGGDILAVISQISSSE